MHDRIPESEKENIEIKHEPRDNYVSDDQFRGGLQVLIPYHNNNFPEDCWNVGIVEYWNIGLKIGIGLFLN